MYKKLWEMVVKTVKKESAVSVYLAVLIIGWTGAVLLAGILFCMGIQTDVVYNLTNIICAGAYAGIIFGLFGGILFLHRFLTKDF